MINIEKVDVHGFEAAIRGMRNPMNSWQKSDTKHCHDYDSCGLCPNVEHCGYGYLDEWNISVGPNDLRLMKNLAKAGTDHRKYLRMIAVYCDITAPLYWWKEFDTYKVGTVANSCSTMHKIQAKKFVPKDFSIEHLKDRHYHIDGNNWYLSHFLDTIDMLNDARDGYLETKDKEYWWAMIQLLPSSYNQKRTVMMNYEVLANIYQSRKNHKLDEWHVFCDWIKDLPYSELITGEENE